MTNSFELMAVTVMKDEDGDILYISCRVSVCLWFISWHDDIYVVKRNIEIIEIDMRSCIQTLK